MPGRYNLVQMSSFQAVQPGSIANLPLPKNGPTYVGLLPQYFSGSGQTVANDAKIISDIERVSVKVNGDAQIELTGQELLELSDFYGYDRAAGVIPIHFVRPEFETPGEEDHFAWGTADVTTLSLEIKLAAAAANPRLVCHGMILRDTGKRNLGQFIRVRSTTLGAEAAAGQVEITQLPITGAGRFLKALHVKAATVKSHELEITKGINRSIVHEAADDLNRMSMDFQAFRTGGRTPQTGYYHIDFAGNRSDSILGTDLDEFRLKLNLNAATPAFKIIHEEVVGRSPAG